MAKSHSGKILCICPECGTEFYEWPSQLLGDGTKCCSNKCGYARRSRLHSKSPTQRFWEKVVKTDSCWIWSGSTCGGRPKLSVPGPGKKILLLACRFSWELANGPILDGLEVCHNCPGGDNPVCVNPAHLFLGTHADNMADASNKGQMARGENHPHRKLTEATVREIRTRYINGGITQQALADEFGLVDSTVSEIVNRKSWRHVL